MAARGRAAAVALGAGGASNMEKELTSLSINAAGRGFSPKRPWQGIPTKKFAPTSRWTRDTFNRRQRRPLPSSGPQLRATLKPQFILDLGFRRRQWSASPATLAGALGLGKSEPRSSPGARKPSGELAKNMVIGNPQAVHASSNGPSASA